MRAAAAALGPALLLLVALGAPGAGLSPPTVFTVIYQAAYNYVPAVSHAAPGEYILWHNGELHDETIYHTVTADDGSFDSGPMNLHYLWGIDMPMEPGAQVRYHCQFHPWMVGLIVVI